MTTGEYRPTIDAARVERLRRWHDDAYATARAEAGEGQRFDYLGLTLEVPPEVQPITRMSHLLGDAVVAEVRADDDVLDMGTGCGVNALLAARTARHVIAVDINPVALDATRRNAIANGVADRVVVRESDVFSAVPETFDVIVFDPPYRWFAPRDLLETATADFEYGALRRFFAEVGDHLRPGARLLMAFGTTGDIGYFHALATRAGVNATTVASDTLEKNGETVEYFAYRLTRR